jgi:hypothetical protein
MHATVIGKRRNVNAPQVTRGREIRENTFFFRELDGVAHGGRVPA